MNSIRQKTILNYWIKKIKKNPLVNKEAFQLLNDEIIFIKKEDISYFKRLTNSNVTAEYTVLLSIFNGLVHRYFDFESLIFSLKISKEKTALLLNDNAIKGKTFKAYLLDVKKEVQEVYQYSDYEDKLLNNYPFHQYTNFGFLYGVEKRDLVSLIPFLVSLKATDVGLKLSISYNTSFIKNDLATHFLRTFKNWLCNLENYINEYIEKIPIVSQAEKKQLLETFNNTAVDYPKNKTIVDLFEEQVVKTSDNLAVVFEDKKLTYAKLNERANQLADYLQKNHNVQPDDLAAIKLERSENLLVAILGVLKSGAAYVPIDINYPQQRIEYIEKDSKAKVVIDKNLIENFENIKDRYGKENPKKIVSSNHLAYVIYTSGTTGVPKGVMISHGNAVAMLQWAKREFNSDKFNIVYATTSHCFDLSIYEMFYPLSIGKPLRLLKDSLEIGQNLEADSQVLINTVPSSIRNIINSKINLENVSIINLAGELFPIDIANKLVKTGIEIRNLYGPSEDTTYSTIYKLDNEKEYTVSIPIGKPIWNTRTYILDNNLELLPIGVKGELYISGEGLAKGYLNRPELTSEKFIENPYEKGQKMYSTGDLGRLLPDGNIEFLGRKDYQVKLRGYRIELGEIESTILSYSDNITQVVVLVSNENLVAYFTEKDSIDKNTLKKFLKEKLPSYMTPNHFEVLESIPLTPNGKIDRKTLEGLSINFETSSNYIAPRNEIEQTLAEIWQEVLGVEKIGIRDNFFELGGHSLMIGQVINQIYKRLEGNISYKEFFQDPIIESISKILKRNNYNPIPKVEGQESYPLTSSQHRIWVLSQLEGGSQAYNMSGTVSLSGKLNIDKFKRAFYLLVDRHEILRTCFKTNKEGEVHQYIVDISEQNFDIEFHDFKDKTKEVINEYLYQEQLAPFDLAEVPLLRGSLLWTNEGEYLFSFIMHHIIGDGWSMELLISEVITTYNELLKNKDYKKEALSLQYKDYSVWLQSQLTNKSYKTSEAYWLNKFQGELPVLNLPSFKKRPLIQTYNGNTVNHQFSKDFLSKLKQFSKENDSTLFMTLMAGVNALLYRYTNQDDIIIGTPIAGREHPDLENQIGLYLNILAIRTQLKRDYSFKDLLQQQKQTLLETYEHQNYPFDELVSKFDLKRDTSRSALFDVMMVLQNQNQIQSISSNNHTLEGIQVTPYELERSKSQLDVSFTFVEENEKLHLEIEYNTDIYDEFLITRMFSHFENLLSKAIDDSKKKLLTIDYLTKEESKQILEEFNNTKVDYPKNKTIIDLFEEQVEKTPNNIAVVFESKQLTYKELNEQSNQLAQYLREKYTIQPDDLIGIKLDRSEQLLVTIFGILKSGGAYVPIDINYPQERINYIEKDSNCKVVINEEELENFKSVKNKYSIENLKSITKPYHLAYVIYTSGTTGKPKGVLITNNSHLDYGLTFRNYFNLTNTDSILQQSSISFDTSVEEIFPILISGGKLVVIKENNDFDKLFRKCEEQKISLLSTNPYALEFLNQNVSKYKSLIFRILISGGDKLNTEYISNLYKKFEVYNTYGPTESTVCATYHKVEFPTKTVPIGKPISNRKIFITNDKNSIQPIGVVGELWISGSGLALGYLNKNEITKDKFIENPFIENNKIYKSGDLARWLPDGNIEFLGRNDYQVKLRGYRIELGEIETVIKQYSKEIENVVVIVREINQEKVLISYYVSSCSIDKSSLKTFLQKKLPAYMIPDFYIQLDSFKLTPNGKIDKTVLPNISGEDSIRKTYIAPKKKIEKQLVTIWEEVLGIKKIGITDNFFELGGHSLKITKLRNLVNKKFNTTISFNDFFIESTVENQSKLIKESTKSKYQDIPLLPKQDSYAISSSQQRIWMLSQFEGGNTAYNMPGVFLLEGTIDVKVMKKVFHSLIERHEVLRTRFKEDVISGEIKQLIYATEQSNFEFVYEDTKFLNASEEDIKQLIEIESNYSFDLSKECLLRAKLIKTQDERAFLIFVIHHIISDGWSLEIITNELFQFYNAFLKNEVLNLEPLTIQYKDYALWEQNQLLSDKAIESKKYWEQQFQGGIPVLELPINKNRPRYKTYSGKVVTQKLSKDVLKQFKLLCQSNNSTLFMGLVAVVKYLLYKYSNQKDIIVGTPIAGREHTLLQGQVGVYINTLALRTNFKGEDSFEALLKKVKETTLNAYEHQFYPFDKLVSDLPLQRDLSRNPLFDVMVTLQNTDNSKQDSNTVEGLQINEYVSSDTVMSKIDLEFIFEEKDDELVMALLYNSDIFDAKFITNVQTHLNNTIKTCIKTPKELLYQLPFLTSKEESELIHKSNDTVQNYNKEQTFLDVFRKQVKHQPNAIAVIDEEQQYTYKELDSLSTQIAVYINSNFENEKEAIGVMLDRSAITIAVLLGILKSTRAYIPLDPTFPVERLKYIIEHSGLKVLISSEELSEITTDKINTITAKEILSKSYDLEDTILTNPTGNDTAYIIYTSGSTGNPKGVEIGHRSLLNFLLSIKKEPGIKNTDILFAVTTYSFDISILEFFTPLISGGAVYIVSNEILAEPEKTIGLLENVKPTIIQATPSFYQQLFSAGWNGNKQLKILCGGDALSESLADQLLKSSLELWNMYGPTETTIWSTLKKIGKANQVNIIGKPIANTSLYVLSEFLKLRPKGSIGNLFIGGNGLAKGYYKEDELTKQRFIKNPFDDGLIYETGDIVKWNDNDELVFLGRNDNQVKIRGYRIELGDIETKLNEIRDVKTAIVVAKKDASKDSFLVAYFTSESNLEINSLHTQLKEMLPYYMIPSQFIKLDDFPLTPNKKINRKALTNLDNANLISSKEYLPPNTETEKKLVELWKEVLSIEQIGVKDNFFDLGGHSLSVTKLVSSIQKEFSIKVSLNKIFETPVLEDQSCLIENIQLVSPHNLNQDEEIEFESFSI